MTITTTSEPSLMTIEEASAYLRLSRAKVYAMAQSGQIPTVRMGRSVRVRRDRLERWLDEHSR